MIGLVVVVVVRLLVVLVVPSPSRSFSAAMCEPTLRSPSAASMCEKATGITFPLASFVTRATSIPALGGVGEG